MLCVCVRESTLPDVSMVIKQDVVSDLMPRQAKISPTVCERLPVSLSPLSPLSLSLSLLSLSLSLALSLTNQFTRCLVCRKYRTTYCQAKTRQIRH